MGHPFRFLGPIALMALGLGCSDGDGQADVDDGGTIWSPIELEPSWITCDAASDCVLVEAACCDHCNSGQLVSVNSENASSVEALKQTGCNDVMCTLLGCAAKVAICQDGACAYKDKETLACSALDQAACAAESACGPIMGAPAEPVCAGNYDAWLSEYAGCKTSDGGCGDAESCAIHPGSGDVMIFPNTCTPDGWMPVDCCPPTWFSSCGDPVCGPDSSAPAGTEACGEGMTLGQACGEEGATCDASLGCGAVAVCATGDPTLKPEGCPKSTRAAKSDIRYLSGDDLQALNAELMSLPLATWRYKGAGGPARLGFIIEDAPYSPAVSPDGYTVDVYGFAALAAAALQAQSAKIEALEARLRELESKQNQTTRP